MVVLEEIFTVEQQLVELAKRQVDENLFKSHSSRRARSKTFEIRMTLSDLLMLTAQGQLTVGSCRSKPKRVALTSRIRLSRGPDKNDKQIQGRYQQSICQKSPVFHTSTYLSVLSFTSLTRS